MTQAVGSLYMLWLHRNRPSSLATPTARHDYWKLICTKVHHFFSHYNRLIGWLTLLIERATLRIQKTNSISKYSAQIRAVSDLQMGDVLNESVLPTSWAPNCLYIQIFTALFWWWWQSAPKQSLKEGYELTTRRVSTLCPTWTDSIKGGVETTLTEHMIVERFRLYGSLRRSTGRFRSWDVFPEHVALLLDR